jgi:hypothetical protein
VIAERSASPHPRLPPARSRPCARRAGGGLLAAIALIATLAGCGLGAGPAPSAIELTVTRDFGAHTLRAWNAPRVHGQETVMSLLMRNATVTTRYGGGFVQSVNGFAGATGSPPRDWFYYVNGVLAPQGAAATNIHPGDHIWWDLHDWSQTDTIPAVVGSFPEPFLNGIAGKRLPVRIECATIAAAPCQTVSSRLRALGVPAALAAIGPGDEPETLRVLVGPWQALAGTPAAHQLELGPRASGVYARVAPDGSALTLLDEQGAAARTLTAGAGLIAATRYAESAPVWVVTGTDTAGVALAAHAFDRAALANRFALVLAPGGLPLPAPAPVPASTSASTSTSPSPSPSASTSASASTPTSTSAGG